MICNILKHNDCLKVRNGNAYVRLIGGESKIYEAVGVAVDEHSFWVHYALIGFGLCFVAGNILNS